MENGEWGMDALPVQNSDGSAAYRAKGGGVGNRTFCAAVGDEQRYLPRSARPIMIREPPTTARYGQAQPVQRRANRPYLPAAFGVAINGGHLRSEERLIQLARDLDLAALTEIYDGYSPGIFRYAVRLLGNGDLAEDCVAETFSRFLHALQQGGGPTDCLQGYLYQVAHHWIMDHYRRQPQLIVALDESIESDVDDPGEVTDQNGRRERVRAAIMRLTPEQREVVVLKYMEGWENADVAAHLHKPVGAIKALQHRALEALRRLVLPATEKSYE